MKLEVDCSWNKAKEKAKQTIHFDYLPKSIFCMPEEKILALQDLHHTAHLEGPIILDKLQHFLSSHPDSLYALVIYYQILQFFGYVEDGKKLLNIMKKQFSGEVFVECMLAKELLEQGKVDQFFFFFGRTEVLQGVFPKRSGFFFEEALFFHHLWMRYFSIKGNLCQLQKHQQFINLMMNTLNTFHRFTFSA